MAYVPTREETVNELIRTIREESVKENKALFDRKTTDDNDEKESDLEDAYKSYMTMTIEARKLTVGEYTKAELDEVFDSTRMELTVPSFEEYINML